MVATYATVATYAKPIKSFDNTNRLDEGSNPSTSTNKTRIMKNPNSKLKLALNIIRKFNANIHVQRTESEDVVYLFDYSTKKKTVGSLAISKAVERAAKQQDYPAKVVYSDGMLCIANEAVEPVKMVEPVIVEQPVIVEESEEETETESAEPKKRKRKKKNEE